MTLPPIPKEVDDYARMELEEKKFKARLRQAHYKYTSPECCLTCDNMRSDFDNSLECIKLSGNTWQFGGIHELGICDYYKRRK